MRIKEGSRPEVLQLSFMVSATAQLRTNIGCGDEVITDDDFCTQNGLGATSVHREGGIIILIFNFSNSAKT